MSLRSAVVFLLVVLAVVAGQAPAFAGKKTTGGGSTLNPRDAGVQASGAYVVVDALGRIDDYTPASNSNRDTLTVNAGTFTFTVGSETTSCDVSRAIFQSHENFEWFGAASAFDVSAYFTCSNADAQYTVFYPHCVGVVRSDSAAQPTFTLDAASECGASVDVKLKGQKRSTRLADGVAAPFTLTADVQ